jgi:cell division protein FtsL
MKINQFRIFNKGFALLGTILAVAIILLMAFYVLKAYQKKPAIDESTQTVLQEQGIDTSSQKAVLDSAKDRITDLNKQILDREQQQLDRFE